MTANTADAPTAASSTAPITGPMTREPFICAECREMAPGRSSRPTSWGSRAEYAGLNSAWAMPMANTTTTSATMFGSSGAATAASTNDSTSWDAATPTSRRRRSTVSASTPPITDSSSIGPSWANRTTPTNVADPVTS